MVSLHVLVHPWTLGHRWVRHGGEWNWIQRPDLSHEDTWTLNILCNKHGTLGRPEWPNTHQMHHPLFPVVSPSNSMNHHSRNLTPPWIHVGVFLLTPNFLSLFSFLAHSLPIPSLLLSLFFFLLLPLLTFVAPCLLLLCLTYYTHCCLPLLASHTSPTQNHLHTHLQLT
jgi:hypothetical protein